MTTKEYVVELLQRLEPVPARLDIRDPEFIEPADARSAALFPFPLNARPALPLVVLVSERTSSAAEILAAALQAQGRAKIVGTPTCGCVLAIRSRYTLPDEGVLDVSEFDYRTASGIRLERLGVEPNLVVQPKRYDLYTNRDRGLEAAVELLAAQTHLKEAGAVASR